MKLSRHCARLVLALTVGGICAIPVGILIGGSGPFLGIGVFVILYLTASGIQMRYLRCPYCRKSVLPAKWSRKGPVFCPKCKRQVLWDS